MAAGTTRRTLHGGENLLTPSGGIGKLDATKVRREIGVETDALLDSKEFRSCNRFTATIELNVHDGTASISRQIRTGRKI